MKKYYKPMRVDHMKRLALAEENQGEPYTLTDFEDDDDDSDARSPLPKRARTTPQNRHAINSDDERIVEITPPKKRARRIAQKAPKARRAAKGNVHRLQKTGSHCY